MEKILVVEDDNTLSESICNYLKEEGYQSASVFTISEALQKEKPDLYILDWRLPDGRGIDFLKELRAKTDCPVIMLTSKSDLEDKVLGLELGANDYMTKPFEPKELLARVNVQLRKQNKSERSFSLGEITVNEEERRVFFKEQEIFLANKEYELLRLFMNHPKKAFSRDELLNKVWGFESFPTTRTVDVHVQKLRQKFKPEMFKTVYRIGYQFLPNKN